MLKPNEEVIRTIYCEEVTVTDPDTESDIELEVHKDPVTGAILAVESRFLDDVSSYILSPFKQNQILLLSTPNGERDENEMEYQPKDGTHLTGAPASTLYCCDVDVKDPDTGEMVTIEIHKDRLSCGLFGVEASARSRGIYQIPNPFNDDQMLILSDGRRFRHGI